jgi:hypothetical protein
VFRHLFGRSVPKQRWRESSQFGIEAITCTSQLPPSDFPILILKEEMVSDE